MVGEQAMHDSSQPNGTLRTVVLAASAVLLLAVLSLAFSRYRKSSPAAAGSDSTARVERKTFRQTLRLHGTTQAARSFVVLAPRLEGAQVGSMVITKLASAGLHVNQGDLLVEFDSQAQEKDYLDKKSTYDNLVSQVDQKRGDEEITRAKDDTALKQAEDELQRAQLELQKNEIVSKIDAEKNQEAVDEAQATLAQLKQTYQLKRNAGTAAIRILEIQRDRAQEAMRYAQSNAAKMVVHAPMPGVVVHNTIWLGGRMGTVEQGDQVRPGVPFLQVVDPSKMEVRVDVNQVDLQKLHPGQTAAVGLDAYPGLAIPAELDELSPLGHPGQFADRVRSFTATFSVHGSDPRLLPDLSAALDLELGSQAGVLMIPCQSVAIESGQAYVWVKNSRSFEKREVKLGPRNDLETIVLSGLVEGDIIRRISPQDSRAEEGH